MKSFEISSKENKNGRREFKAILCEIHPDSCVNTVDECGELYNKNGITWIRDYCEEALPTIEGMSLRCEFLDDERTEICGHGLTDIADGEPVFADATVIGHFTKGYIEDVETESGNKTFCIGEGEIDASCYHNFCEKLDAEIGEGLFTSGSVEFIHADDEDEIIYLYGYKEKGRIPYKFRFSGYALLAVEPADDEARLIELNEKYKEDTQDMTEDQMKVFAEMVKSELCDAQAEINQCKEDCKAKIAEANSKVEAIEAEKVELNASVAQVQEALNSCKSELDAKCAELDAKYQEVNELHGELDALRKELAEAQAKERIGELNSALSDFDEAELKFAEAEIEAFKADPINAEINSVISKIWEEIGKQAKAVAAEEQAKAVAEMNSVQNEVIDIFSAVESVEESAEDINIF